MAQTNPVSKITPIAGETLRDQILQRCRRMMMSGRFVPGQKLSLRPLADEFNTSLMPVRDALNRLVADGALEFSSSRRIRVPILSDDQIIELHEIRMSLEGLAAEHATMNISNHAIDRAEELIGEMAESYEAGDFEVYIDKHYSFHFTIYAAANRPALLDIIESLWLKAGPSFRQTIERAYEAGGDRGDPNANHRIVVAGLRARDPKATRSGIEQDVFTGIEVSRSGVWL